MTSPMSDNESLQNQPTPTRSGKPDEQNESRIPYLGITGSSSG